MLLDGRRDYRLAVISDVHGNLAALEAVLADIKTRGVDATVNLGDCATSPLWPAETCELLAKFKLPTVRGNHDRWVFERGREELSPAGQFTHDALSPAQRASLGKLPSRLEVATDVLAVHGTPTDDCSYLLEEMSEGRLVPARRDVIAQRLDIEPRIKVVLCGHSHNQAMRMALGDCLIVNPGSVGCPVFADNPAARTLEPRSPHARYAILAKKAGRWSVEMFALDYDWSAAAARATANGRPDWAQGLATGTVG